MSPAPRHRAALWAGLAAAALLAAMWLLSSWTGPGAPPATAALAIELGVGLPPALAWMLMAFGIGWPLRLWLVPERATGTRARRFGAEHAALLLDTRWPLQTALGVAGGLWLDEVLGAAGLLSSAVAWSVLLVGAAAGLVAVVRAIRGGAPSRSSGTRDAPVEDDPGAPRLRVLRERPLHQLLALCAVPALGLLLVAACSAPGWLWSSEFGGYDALSYHLTLPKEWLAAGRVAPSEHNVYGFLPGYVEAAFLHLMALHGDGADAAISAAVSAQLLHALLAVVACWAIGGAAAAWCGDRERAPLAFGIAAAMALATPWVVVVGSLAYNEMATCLFLAAGLLLLRESTLAPARLGAALGLVAGAACAAKLTALGFVAAPLALVLLATRTPRRWLVPSATGATAALVVLAPWLVRNAFAAGNPFFPFLTSVFGAGHWSAEQAETFARGHRSGAGLGTRLMRLAQQWLLYGFGPNPTPGEPWKPQWSLLPWLGLLGGVSLGLRRRTRNAALLLLAVMAVQIAFWLGFTHLQSRFLLPTVVPLAMLVGIGAAHLLPASPNRWTLGAVASGLVAFSLVPLGLARGEAGGAPALAIGQTGYLAGDVDAALLARGSSEVLEAATPALFLNHLLPEGARVLLVGEARPFYLRGRPAAFGWQTTWDRGPLSEIMRREGDDPASWSAALRRDGWTHVLIDPSMLERWERSGWNDPLITAERVRRLADAPNEVVHAFPHGALLVRLAPAG